LDASSAHERVECLPDGLVTKLVTAKRDKQIIFGAREKSPASQVAGKPRFGRFVKGYEPAFVKLGLTDQKAIRGDIV
jgi:hypothetical protein